MGEIADAILNGDFDEETGEWIGEGDGYPRSPTRDARERAERKQKKAGSTMNVHATFVYLKKHRQLSPEDAETVVVVYGIEHGVKINLDDKQDSIKRCCDFIQTNWSQFVKWFKNQNRDAKD